MKVSVKGKLFEDDYKPSDKGKCGKLYEKAMHEFFLKKPELSDACKMVTPNVYGQADFKVKQGNKFLRIEAKTGAGVLSYNTSATTLDEAIERVRDSKWDYMVYIPQYIEGMDIGKSGYVFSKSQFMDFILGYSSPMIRIKKNTNGFMDITFQEFNSNKKQNYLWDYLETLPTVDEFLKSVRA